MKKEEAELVAANIATLERLIALTQGRLRAMECLLNVLISTHPDPAKLNRLWNSNVLAFVDRWMESESFQNERFRHGFQCTAANWSHLIEAHAQGE
ncbi:hypothetical protein [Lysobacter sp. GCM10012299]|uniref:hypothetical protein n=1 Tax=Lysobacter sp. GCM10012299 TaxID=3317333 RepID=UPI003611265C